MSGNSKKTIWIVNYYNCPPDYVVHPRQLEFTRYLQQAGYSVLNFSSGFIRDRNINLVPKNKKYIKVSYGEYNFIHIKARKYIGNSISRIISIYQFAWRLFKYCKSFEKPDIIIHSVLIPFDYPIRWCAIKLKAKYFVEVLDLWPDSFVRFGLMKPYNPFVNLFYRIEKHVYEVSDHIIFSFEGGIDYLKNKKWLKGKGGNIDPKKISYINNGVSIQEFKKNLDCFQINDIDLNDDTFFKIIYLGSIRYVNNLKKLIESANLVLKINKRIKFLIYGDGEDRVVLEEYCNNNKITNVIFKEKWIPLKMVPFVLSHSSLNILNYRENFGIYGASPGKLFLYLAAGKPICSNISMNYCIIKKYNLGIAEDLDTPQKYASAILSIASMDEQSYSEMCCRVKNMAMDFDYSVLSKKLINIIKKIK